MTRFSSTKARGEKEERDASDSIDDLGRVGRGDVRGDRGAAPLGTTSLYGTSNGLLSGAMLGQGRPGADGNFWFLDNNRGNSPFGNKAIGSINLTTHLINEYPLPDGKVPRFLGAGPDGNLWVSVVATAAIDQVVPNGAVPPTVNAFGTRAGSRPNQLGKGPDANLWFTDSGSPKAIGLICLTVSRLCTAGDVSSHTSHEYTGRTPCSSSTPVCSGSLYAGSTPRFVAAGPDGNVWFTDNGTTPAIGEINTHTASIAEWSIASNGGSVGRSPGTIAAGPDGKLWFADAVAASPAIGEFDPTNDTITEFGHSNGLQTGSLVNGTMEGPDGNMWFTDSAVTAGDAPIDVICLTVSPACTNDDVAGHAIHEFATLTYPTSIGNSGGIGADGDLWWTDLSTSATPGGMAIAQSGLGVCGGDSLEGCNMRGADLQNISLDGANMQGANLNRAQLENASLVGANLVNANLNWAQLQSYAQLSYANLQDANFHGADLTGANLTGADLTGANLHGANLTSVFWSNTTCPDGTDSNDDGGTCANNHSR